KRHAVLSFTESGDEFRIYIDTQTRLPAQTEILEDDPLEGDSSYTLRYGDWRKVDGVMLPFNLRYELNGKALQEEQIKSIRHNAALAAMSSPSRSPCGAKKPTPRRSHPNGFCAASRATSAIKIWAASL